jgi:hypothetical protein
LGALPVGKADITFGSFGGSGQEDLFYLPYAATGSGRVEVHVLSAASTYQTFVAHAATVLSVASVVPGDWTFLVAESGGRGDLLAVHGSGSTGSGRVEVHTLAQASGYLAFSLHAATALGSQDRSQAVFMLGSASDDLYLLQRGAMTGSGMAEVHALGAASSYTQFVVHAVTAFGPVPDTTWRFAIG